MNSSSENILDVAIVGAGPGGGSAANRLALSGLSVVVLEKDNMPRLKPCGGLMPSAVRKWLDCDLAPFTGNRVSQVLNLNNHQQPVEQAVKGAHLMLVDRAEFDAYLVHQAVARSGGRVRFREGFVLQQATEQAGHVELHARNGECIRARYVVAADGVTSRTARSSGLRRKPDLAVAMDSEIEVSDEFWQQESTRLTFNYFCLPAGYGWIFPKRRPFLSCGVGCWRGAADVREKLVKFIGSSIPAEQLLNQHDYGFPIPIWSGAGTIASRRIALVGDAAGLVDPVSGEGIRYAILSGRLAAEAIIEAISGNAQEGVQPYQARLYEQIAEGMDFKRKFVFLPFTQSSDYFYRNFIDNANGYATGIDHLGEDLGEVSA